MVTIKRMASGAKVFYIAMDGEREAGLMATTPMGPDKFSIDHTEVEKDYEGKGVGKQLVLAAVADAREHHQRVVLYCPFAKVLFKRDPSLQDVLS